MADNKLISKIAEVTNGPGKYELMQAVMEGASIYFTAGETCIFEGKVKKLERQGGNQWVINGKILCRWIPGNFESTERAMSKEKWYENTPLEFECNFNTHYRKGSLKEY